MTDTIFMIHGMWGGPWYWENYKSFFEKEGYRCVTTTLRFHDMNPKDIPDPRLGTTSLLDYADDIEQELRQLGVKPIVMGHSMGGLLAQILGSRGLAKELVLLCPASPSGIMAMTPSVIRSFQSVQTKCFLRKPMRQTFDEAVYALHRLPPEEQRKNYEKFVYESGRAAFEIGYWFFDFKRTSKVDASKVTCPVLIIAGSEDNMTPASVVQKIANKYKTVSTYKEFENMAHCVCTEPGWQDVATYVNDWLKQKL